MGVKIPRKQRKLQIIKKENQRIDISSVTNEEIKHFIKLYMKGIKEVK